jgi:hypothetical protein
MVMEVEY